MAEGGESPEAAARLALMGAKVQVTVEAEGGEACRCSLIN